MERIYFYLRSLTLAYGALLTSWACATQWTVSNDTLQPAQFTSLQFAVDSASVGDTVLVTGTGASYGVVIVDKPLVLIGTGYAPTDQATIVDELDIRSSDVLVTGFSGSIKLNAFNAPGQELLNVRVTRSMGGIDHRGSNTLGEGLFSNVRVSECIVSISFANGWAENRFVFDTLLYSNNIFTGSFFVNPNGGQSDQFIGTETIILDHNDFLGNGNNWGAFWSQYIATPAWPAGEMFVSNNIFRGTGPRGCPNCCFINNMTFGAGPEDSDTVPDLVCGGGNYWGVDPGITGGQFNINNDYTLPLGSPALLAGSDGTDIGITGGMFPLVVGAPPPGPKIDFVDVDEVAVPPDSMFHYEVLARAFETPGILLDSLEYLFDTDGGIGTGTTVAFPPTTNLELLAEAYALGLDSGAHALGVRVRDQSGTWSASKWTALDVCNTYGPDADFTIYRSGRSVSLVDHSTAATSIEYDFGDGQSGAEWNPYHTYAEAGLYSVAQIVSGPCGVDTAYQVASISGLSSYQPKKAANGGFCTISISGAGLDPSMEFRLVRSGTTLVPLSIDVLSPSSARAEFDLNDADTGFWDVELEIPGDTIHVITDGFKVLAATQPRQIVCTITGPPVVRSNTWTTYNVEVHNPNGNDVFAVPVWTAHPQDLDWDLVTPLVPIVFPGSDTLALEFVTDSLWGEPYEGTAYPVVISRIPAFSTVNLSFQAYTTASTGAADLMAWAERPLLGTTGDETGLDQSFGAAQPSGSSSAGGSPMGCMGCFLDLLPTLPGWSCGTSIGGGINYAMEWTQVQGSRSDPANWGPVALKIALECGSLLVPSSAILKYLKKLKKAAEFGDCLAQDCLPLLSGPKRVGLGCACDPNDKYGPIGVATDNYVSPREEVSYIIMFENVDSSLFSAQRIMVVDTLDGSVFDLGAARLGSVGLADSLIYHQAGERYVAEVLPLTSGYDLRMNAEIDTLSGIARWELLLIDPVDQAVPNDPLAGFLPPNVTSPQGQGFVSLRLPLREALLHGTVLSNKATIVFDNNDAITTGIWTNTIDAMPPSSHVEPLAAITTDPAFVLDISGPDVGCGTEWYEIYVSTDTTSGYELWTVTDSSALIFVGEDALNYHFFSVAIDSVGNREVKADTSEAHTYMDLTTSVPASIESNPAWGLYPNPTTGLIFLSGRTEGSCQLRVEIRNAVGQLLLQESFGASAGFVRTSMDVSSLATGAYIATLHCNDQKLVERLVRVGE